MKRYERYRFIKELWLSKIPYTWKDIKIKNLFFERSEKGYPEEPLLVASQNMGVVPKSLYGSRTVEATKDLYLLKLVKVGDFVISLRSFQGGIEYAYYQGIISPAYTVMVPNEKIVPDYFRYLAKSRLFIELLQLCVTGIREGQNIDYDKLKNHFIPVPSLVEQNQIVNFLDWKVSEINNLISIKKKQVSLYKELRKALVDEGILYGFRKGKSKESGVYWLGNIPESWEILPLKRVCKVNASISDIVKTMDDSDLVTFIPMSSVSATGNTDYSEKGKIADFRKNFSSFARGDVVVAKITPCFENGKGACLDKLDTAIGFGTTEFINLRPTSRILSRYLYMITVTRPFRELGENVMTGSAGQKRVPVNYIKNFTLGIPGIEEQKEILEKVDRKLEQVDELISAEIQSIKELQKLKTTLISDVVTGKIDVRNVEIPEYERVEEDFTEDDSSEMSEEIEKQED